MKRFYFFTMVLLAMVMLIFLDVKAQKYYYATYPDDTINLSVSANGHIQWQQTEDTTATWTNISGATTNNFTIYPSASTTGFRYFRAEIQDSSICYGYK